MKAGFDLNPLNLSGPHFLVFFVVLFITSWLVTRGLAWMVGWRIWGRVRHGVPVYQLALVEQGEQAIFGVALASLLNQRLITLDGNRAKIAPVRAPRDIPDFEKITLGVVSDAGEEGANVFEFREGQSALEFAIEGERAANRIDGLTRGDRWHFLMGWLVRAPLLLCLTLGTIRLVRGIAHGRPVLFLVGLLALAIFATSRQVLRSRKTASGAATLKAYTEFYGALESTANIAPQQLSGWEFAMAMALFGEPVMANRWLPLGHFFLPIPKVVTSFLSTGSTSTSGHSSFTSCASSCGSSCGGGGCGGCGG